MISITNYFVCVQFVLITSSGEVYKTLMDIGPNACLAECSKYHSHCDRAVYDPIHFICELVTGSSSDKKQDCQSVSTVE